MELVAINERTKRPIIDIDPLTVDVERHVPVTGGIPGLAGLMAGVSAWWDAADDPYADRPGIVWNGDPDIPAVGVCMCCSQAFPLVDLHPAGVVLECGNCDAGEQPGCPNCDG